MVCGARLGLENAEDRAYAPERETTVASKLGVIRPGRTDPVVLQEVIDSSGRGGTEDGIWLEDEEMLRGSEIVGV